MKNKAMVGIVAAVIIILLILVFFGSWPRAPKFNAGKWKRGTKVSRGAMVEDLIEQQE
jgi:hypothetical protein